MHYTQPGLNAWIGDQSQCESLHSQRCSACSWGPPLPKTPGGRRRKPKCGAANRYYRQSLKSRDKEAYLPLKDEVFLGWPSYAKSPVRKSTFRERPLRAVDSYTFEQKSVQMFGETAMTFLQVRLKPSTSGKEGEIVLRITHTWRKKDGEWRIVGGMSCNVNPDGTC